MSPTCPPSPDPRSARPAGSRSGGPRPRGRVLARTALLTTTVLGGLLAAAPAGAAWTPSTTLPFGAESIVTGGTPGQVAFAGVDDGGTGRTALHLPGVATLRTATSPVPADALVTYGEGGALAFSASGSTELQLGTLGPNGAYVAAGTLTIDPDDLNVEAVAASGGAVAAVGLDSDGLVHLLTARPGRAATDEVVSDGSYFATTADIAPSAAGGFLAAWNEGDEAPTPTSVIAGLRVEPDGTRGGRLTLAGDDVPAGATLSTVGVPDGATVPAAVWSGSAPGSDGQPRSFVMLSTEGVAPREVVSLAGEEPPAFETRAFPSGRILVAATVLAGDADPVPVTKVLPPTADPDCTATGGIPDTQSAVVGGAIALVGTTATGTIVRQDVNDDCTTAGPVNGPTEDGASIQRARADAEGSLVVAVSTADGGGRFAVDDRTPPALTDVEVPSRAVAGERLTASVDARDAWGIDTVTWRLDGRTFDEGTAASGRAPAAGVHRLEVTVTDAAGNRSRAGADVTVVDPESGAAPVPVPGGAGADVPLPRPSKPGKPRPRKPGDPTVRIRSVVETSKGWVLRLRVQNASRVRLRLYRQRYLGAGELRRRPTCPVRPRPLRRPPSGLRGRTTVVVDGSSVALRIPRPLADALRKRGRYTLSVVALGTGSRARTASSAANRSFTAC